MDFLETDEQRMLRESVRQIASRYGHDYYVEKARSDGRTTELWTELAAQGFLGVNIPEEHGGGGLGLYELTLVCEELAAAGCPLLLLLVSPAIVGNIVARFGSEEQKARWLPGIGDGTAKVVFAITEPNAGSNSHRLETRAVRDGDGYRITGSKYYISGVDEAEAILVVTRTDDPETGRAGLSLFVVDADAEGLTRELIPMEIQAPEKQYTLFLDGVRVEADRLIGPEGAGLAPLFHGLNPERILGAALGVGVGRFALAKASAYANERAVWGKPIGSHQGIAHPLAEAKVDIELARLMMQKAAWLYDRDEDASEAANMAKYAAAEAGIKAIDQAIQTHGGNGMSAEYGLVNLWGMVRTLRIAPVSREMILNFIAQHGLGLPKSY